MKYHWDKKYLYWGVTAFCVIALSILFFIGVFYIDEVKQVFLYWLNIFMPVIYGFVIGYLLAPEVNYIEKHFIYPLIFKKLKATPNKKIGKLVRGTSILITIFLTTCILIGFFALLIPQLFISISSLVVSFPGYYENFYKAIRELFVHNPEMEAKVMPLLDMASIYIEKFLNHEILPKVNEFFNQIYSDIFVFVKIMGDLLLGVVVAIYVLSSKELFAAQFKKCVYAVLKPYRANIVIKDLRLTNTMFSGFISGTLIDSFIVGIVCFIATKMMDIPYAVLVSVLIAVTNVIPFIGPYLGAIPCAILILIVNPVKCIYFIIFIMILQTIDGNILAPKILGRSIGISSFWVIIAILIGGGLFGLLGMFIGVPILAIIYYLVRANVNRTLEENELPIETSEYLKLYYLDEESFERIYDMNKKDSEEKLQNKVEELKERRDEDFDDDDEEDEYEDEYDDAEE
jgi:predicted PurR-regulated permease PerM